MSTSITSNVYLSGLKVGHLDRIKHYFGESPIVLYANESGGMTTCSILLDGIVHYCRVLPAGSRIELFIDISHRVEDLVKESK